jgi:hypothetical protein
VRRTARLDPRIGADRLLTHGGSVAVNRTIRTVYCSI